MGRIVGVRSAKQSVIDFWRVNVSIPYVNRIIKGREQIGNKTFVKMMDQLGYDVELTYKKKGAL